MARIAIIGATGAVGREMLEELSASRLDRFELGLFASPRSAGESLLFRGKAYEVKAFSLEALKGYDFCLMSAGGAFSKQFSENLVKQGTTVIDNSSAWRMAAGVPLIVPEVNGETLKTWKTPGIIANPNCSTIQMVVALEPLRRKFGLDSVQVATYQSVSGTGQKGIRELSTQVEAQFKFGDAVPKVYAKPIAFNVLPAIDVLAETGHCYEEEKMVRETRKIMNLPSLEVLATTARVPTYHCHCEAVHVRLENKTSREQALEVLGSAPGIVLYKDNNHALLPTPRDVTNDSKVHIARVRTPLDTADSHWLQMWIVADNLKKGAATNAVQILELIS